MAWYNLQVHFAPWDVPLHRRLETLALAWHVVSIPFLTCAYMLCWAFPPFWPLMIAYTLYVVFDDSPENGAASWRYSEMVRSLTIWKYFARFFPVVLHKTVHLDPAFVPVEAPDGANDSLQDAVLRKNVVDPTDPLYTVVSITTVLWRLTFWWYYYLFEPVWGVYQSQYMPTKMKSTGKRYIFGYHPHGIICMGLMAALGTEGTGWSTQFPGIPVSVLTLTNQFRAPFYREYLMSLGFASVSRRSCRALLSRGQSIAIAIGGAQESLLARPDSMDLVLQRRKGFVRLALETGNVSLVPILAFGENDLYDQVVPKGKDSWVYRVQESLKKSLGFTLPLMNGRGIFNYDVGLIPYRRPVNVVVGRPIAVPHIAEPSEKQIDHYQGLYIAELMRIFDDNKAKYFQEYNGSEGLDHFQMRLVE